MYTFLYTTGDNLAGPTLAPPTTSFVIRSDELLSSKYGRSATDAERPFLIPSNYESRGRGPARLLSVVLQRAVDPATDLNNQPQQFDLSARRKGKNAA